MVTAVGPVPPPPPEDEEELPPHPDKERTAPAQTNANRVNGRGIRTNTSLGIRVLRTSWIFETDLRAMPRRLSNDFRLGFQMQKCSPQHCQNALPSAFFTIV